jgi:excisionase family DNA binding protein
MRVHGTEWLRVAEVARRLGVSTSQVRILIRQDVLSARRHSNSDRGMFLVHKDECDRYLAADAIPVA